MWWGSGETNLTNRWLWIPEKDWYNDTHGSGSLDNSLARGFTHGYITTVFSFVYDSIYLFSLYSIIDV
ncbi:hypothetical protein Hanom_Chr02g00106341 [Helianthus anomalus]